MVITCSLLVIAAVVLMLGHNDGLHFLVPALIAVLVGGVVNAWVILVRAHRLRRESRPRSPVEVEDLADLDAAPARG